MLTQLSSFDVSCFQYSGVFDPTLFKLRFKKAKIKVDSGFKEFTKFTGLSEPFTCNVSKAQENVKFSTLLGAGQPLDAEHLCWILWEVLFFGYSLLDIPKGEEEVNILLGRVVIDGKALILGIEHEIENGEEKIHFHAWSPDHKEDDLVLVFQVV